MSTFNCTGGRRSDKGARDLGGCCSAVPSVICRAIAKFSTLVAKIQVHIIYGWRCCHYIEQGTNLPKRYWYHPQGQVTSLMAPVAWHDVPCLGF